MIAVLSNPLSTQNKLAMDKIRDVIENSHDIFHYEISTIEQINDALVTFADLSPEVLVINGGDGTVQAVLTHIVTHKYFDDMPPIVVLPAGKTNMIAEDLGAIGRVPHEELRRLISMRDMGILQDAITSRQLLTLDGLEGNSRLCGMFFGTAGIEYAI